jgi:quercetin dioxygenase-like cupin family protein
MHHASSGEVVDIQPLGSRVRESQTTTLVKTDQLEIIRLMLPAGKEIPAHQVAGPITVQCLEGRVEFYAHDKWLSLGPGQLVYLDGHQSHALKGVEDASALVTIQLRPGAAEWSGEKG